MKPLQMPMQRQRQQGRMMGRVGVRLLKLEMTVLQGRARAARAWMICCGRPRHSHRVSKGAVQGA